MTEIRLNKLTRKFNIGIQTLVDFLHTKGVDVEPNPNAKVSEEYLPALEKKFGEDLKVKQDAEKVGIKMKEIIEKTLTNSKKRKNSIPKMKQSLSLLQVFQ